MLVFVGAVAGRVVRAGVESPSRRHRGAAAAQPEVGGGRRRARSVLHQKHVREWQARLMMHYFFNIP